MEKDELTDYLLNKPKQITESVLDFYEKNPEELNMISNREEIQLGILKYFFIVSIVLIAGSRTIIYLFGENLTNYFTEVVFEVTFEVGNAILGGVLAAFLIERLQKKQYEKNIRYKREVIRLLKKRKGGK